MTYKAKFEALRRDRKAGASHFEVRRYGFVSRSREHYTEANTAAGSMKTVGTGVRSRLTNAG